MTTVEGDISTRAVSKDYNVIGKGFWRKQQPGSALIYIRFVFNEEKWSKFVCLSSLNLLPHTVKESRVKNNPHLSVKKETMHTIAHMAELTKTVYLNHSATTSYNVVSNDLLSVDLWNIVFTFQSNGRWKCVTWFQLAWPLKYSINVNNIVKAWNQSYV